LASNKGYSRSGEKLLVAASDEVITHEARIIAREGERWMSARAECNFSQNFT